MLGPYNFDYFKIRLLIFKISIQNLDYEKTTIYIDLPAYDWVWAKNFRY